jgi:hypothetical protein
MRARFLSDAIAKLFRLVAHALLYLGLWLMTFVGAATVWENVAGELYICTDRFPIISFLPPFLHESIADEVMGRYKYGLAARPPLGGDYFKVPAPLVYAVWLVFVGYIMLLPACLVWLRVYARKRIYRQQGARD